MDNAYKYIAGYYRESLIPKLRAAMNSGLSADTMLYIQRIETPLETIGYRNIMTWHEDAAAVQYQDRRTIERMTAEELMRELEVFNITKAGIATGLVGIDGGASKKN